MKLIIAEKPELGKAIAEALGIKINNVSNGFIKGDEYTVTWCYGHMLEASPPSAYNPAYKSWNMDDLPLNMKPYKLRPRKEGYIQKQLKALKDLLNKSSEIIHAGDPDGEGQLLVDELIDYYHIKAPVKRVLINDNNPKIIKNSFDNLRPNEEFFGLSQSAKARSMADFNYGMNMSRAYSLKAQEKGQGKTLTVGRVQTPILGRIVERDREHEAHKKQTFYAPEATFAFAPELITASYVPSEDQVDENNRIIDGPLVEGLKETALNEGFQAKIVNVVVETKKESAPLPYSLLELQADASKHHNFSPKKTQDITQTLRERHKLITYNRSDCSYLSDEHHELAPGILQAISKTSPDLIEQVSKADPSIKGRAFNSKHVTAHHAIVPTEAEVDWDKLSEDEKKVYNLIAQQFIAQFYPKYEYELETVHIQIAADEILNFKATFTKVLEEGFKAIRGSKTTSTKANVQEGMSGKCVEFNIGETETQPPKRYTQASLLKDLANMAKYVKDPDIKKLLKEKDEGKKGENGGIGTPATRAAIIDGLESKGFIVTKGKMVTSTKLGRSFIDLLPDEAKTPDMTALWHEQQKLIEKGELSLDEFIQEIDAYIEKKISALKDAEITINVAKPTHSCPECGKGLIRRPAKVKKNGYWWGCSGFPKCSFRAYDKNGKPRL